MKRIILEMGTGNDLYGADYTKAACRAVQDALHHSSLILFRSLGLIMPTWLSRSRSVFKTRKKLIVRRLQQLCHAAKLR